jgi:hypothetical protein
MGDLLNPYQRTAVMGVIRAYEKSLRESQRWLNGAYEDGILYHKALVLTVEQRSEAREQIALALNEVRSLAEKLGFEANFENAGDEIRAQMSLHWADLSSRHADGLKSFGTVNPDLAGELDAPLEQLEQIAMKLSWLFTQ